MLAMNQQELLKMNQKKLKKILKKKNTWQYSIYIKFGNWTKISQKIVFQQWLGGLEFAFPDGC